MDIVIKILQFILSFSLLVFIHEFGHFITARIFGMRVEKFYIFFNPALFKIKIGETEYGIGSIPFGGYCKISGMVDESMDTGYASKPPQPYEFRSKPAWQRLIVLVGGVLMNLLLAMVIYMGMSWKWGDQYIANDDVKYGYSFNELGHEIGFQNGDKILSVNGEKPLSTMDVHFELIINKGHVVEVLRNGRPEYVRIEPSYFEFLAESPDFMELRMPYVVDSVVMDTSAAKGGMMKGDSVVAINGESMIFFDQISSTLSQNKSQKIDVSVVRDSAGVSVERVLPLEVSDEGILGVFIKNIYSYVPVSSKEYSFLQAIPAGVKKTGSEINRYWRQLKLIFSPETKAYKSLGGPLMIGSIFPNVWNWQVFWNITAFLSLVLAVMNLLPIPGLDGGHVMFTLYEMITRRKPSTQLLEFATMIGFLLLISLMVYATWNDITRIFFS